LLRRQDAASEVEEAQNLVSPFSGATAKWNVKLARQEPTVSPPYKEISIVSASGSRCRLKAYVY
jgi:hypothetical protein